MSWGLAGTILALGLHVFLTVAAFPGLAWAAAGLIFVVPLLWLAPHWPTGRRLFWTIWAAETLAWAIIMRWLRHATEVIDTPWAPALGLALPVMLGTALGLFPTVWFRVAWPIWRRWDGYRPGTRLLLLAGLASGWVILEWMRHWVLTGWPWLTLATSQAYHPARLQILPWTGWAGLSWLLIAGNLALASWIDQFRKIRREGGRPSWSSLCPLETAVVAVLLASIYIYGYRSLASEPAEGIVGVKIGLIQPYIPQSQKWDRDAAWENLRVLEELSTAARAAGAQLLVWPEAATPWPVLGEPAMADWVGKRVRQWDVPLLLGSLAVEGKNDDPNAAWFNGVFVATPEEGVRLAAYYAKRRLVPFGEYVPWSEWLPFLEKIVPIEGAIGVGREPRLLSVNIGSTAWQAGPMICSEDLFADLARDSAQAGADFFLVVVNNAWFGEEAGAIQHAVHSILRAVECRRPVIRAGNGGWSGVIDAKGRVQYALEDPVKGPYFRAMGVAELPIVIHQGSQSTFYMRHGEWVIGGGFGFFIASLLIAYRGIMKKALPFLNI